MEIRREVDTGRIKELERRIEESEQFIALRPKLQAKLNSLGKELLQAKRDLQDSAAELQVAETKLTESSEQLEMVMLDKEVAEERAEAAELELDDLKEKLAVVQVELNVIKEGGTSGGGGVDPADGKFSLAYIQLERQNERLKEGLLRYVT
jgi:dynactin 1